MIYINLYFLTFIILIQSCSANPKSNITQLDLPTLIPYRDGKLWGYSDKDKNIIIKCKYDDVTFFNEYGLAQVFKANPNVEESYKYPYFIGVIDTLGNEIIPLGIYNSFKQITYDGGNKNKYGPFDAVVYADIQILKIKESFENLMGDCDQSLSEFEPKELNYNTNIFLAHEDYETGTVYNRNGDVILTDSFTIVVKGGMPKRLVNAEFIFAAKHKNQKFFQVFNKNGELVLDKKFKEVNSINDSLYIGVDFESGKSGLYHYSGKILFEEQRFIYSLFDYHTGEIGLISLISSNEEVLYSLKFNKFITPPTNYGKFASGRSPHSHINIFCHNSKLLINYGKDRSEYGLFSNETGEMLVKGYKQMEVDYSFELIMAKNNSTIHLYDFGAKKLNEFLDVDTVIPISQKHFIVTRNSKVGIWSQQTKTYIVDIAFENIDFSLPDVFLAQTVDKKITIFDTFGNKVFPQKFNAYKVIFEEIYSVGKSFRNVNNSTSLNIKPSLVYSGYSKSIHFQFTLEQNYMPNNIRNYYNTDYDRMLKELKKEIVTVILDDSLGNRYRLMPDYSLKTLSKETDLVYRIMDVYFYKGHKENQNFYIDKNNDKHFIKGYEIKYIANHALIIVSKIEGLSTVFYPLNPQKSINYPTAFQSLEFKFFDDSLFYYGESSNLKILLSENLDLLFSTKKDFEIDYKTNHLYIIVADINKNQKYSVYNNQKHLLINHNCVIFPTRFFGLFGIRNCNGEFLGYNNINGIKYFK